MKRRRRLVEEGVRLMHEAHSAERRRFWTKLAFRDNDKWQRGQKLLQEADIDTIAPLSQQLRTADLRPSLSIAASLAESEREKLVASVVNRRSSLLRSHVGQAESTQEPDSCGGRFLIYVPEDNLADGAAKYASSGFFDVDNVPPWDIWVAFSEGMLLSWVPSQLLGLAQRGMDANPEDCIAWLK